MVVLVITRRSWSVDNNSGSTLSNLFDGLDDCEFHSLYFRSDSPKNHLAQSYFRITEGQLLGSLLRLRRAGCEVDLDEPASQATAHEGTVYSFAKRWNASSLWLARELVWVIGRWKHGGIDRYLEQVKPDVIFMPAFGCLYPYRVLKYASIKTGARTILFHADDNYSLRQFRISPLYWLSRVMLRAHVWRAARRASINYCISEEQQEEYSKAFGVQCKLLRKSVGPDVHELSDSPSGHDGDAPLTGRPLQLVFTGNITSGRWVPLVWIGETLDKLNTSAVLQIYSHNQLTPRVRSGFAGCRSIVFNGGVSAEKVRGIQRGADVLIHVESLGRRERLETRLSFSTKLVDYFARRKCIFAVGWNRSASIAYLLRNDAAVVATSRDEAEEKLAELLANRSIITTYARKSAECGQRNHGRAETRDRLHGELCGLMFGADVSPVGTTISDT